MPYPKLPPTPGSSTEIRGKTQASDHAPALSLGPAAVCERINETTSSSPPSVHGSDSSYHPQSPRSPATNKRKYSQSQPRSSKKNEEFSLPPPPSRSRKIIQMKPSATSNDQQSSSQQSAEASTASKGGRKRTNNNGQSAAGRKMARKTAHSLIERRRRSKMNEEFGVLKDLIPACSGQEMHKLAILSASIDYLRYLEQCVADLKTNGASSRDLASPPIRRCEADVVMEEDDEQDEEMADDARPTTANPAVTDTPCEQNSRTQSTRLPSIHNLPSLSQITTTTSSNQSPSLFPLDSRHRLSISSASTTFSPVIVPGITSASTSPMFYPSTNNLANMSNEVQRFSLTSPVLGPQESQTGERSDREAMAALLMLNADRRGSAWSNGASAGHARQADGKQSPPDGRSSSRSGRSISVHDLLSH